MNYSEKLKDPRWQKKRLEVFNRDGFKCRACGDKSSTLNVHHIFYIRGSEPWDAPNGLLITLCENCHNPGPCYENMKNCSECEDYPKDCLGYTDHPKQIIRVVGEFLNTVWQSSSCDYIDCVENFYKVDG